MTVRKFNPGFLTDAELVNSFCVRTAEFELITRTLRESTGNSNPHLIVVGPRGSGKTTLLLRIAAEVRRDPGLSASWFPIVFAEESYEVSTCGEFWLQCLAHLAMQAPREEGEPNLQLSVEELRSVQDDQTLAERSLGAVLDFADRHGQRLVLFAENLNMMFHDIGDAEVGWQLRKTLQTEPRIFLIGSATSRFDEIDKYDRAMYGFFQVYELGQLTTKECQTLWTQVSGRSVEDWNVRALEILSGGNPRLLVIGARFGGRLSLHHLMSDLLDLVDDHTEYFRGRLESLGHQERRVFIALAELWRPASAKEVAGLARLGTSQCSALLGRLVGRGAVMRSGGTPRRREYSLVERMYNIYFLLRRGRGQHQLVKALVRFMAAFYTKDQLRGLRDQVAEQLADIAPFSPQSRDFLLSEIGRTLDEGPQFQESGGLLAKAESLVELGRYEDAVKLCNQIIGASYQGLQRGVNGNVVNALALKAKALSGLDRHTEALEACDLVVGPSEETPSSAIRQAMADASVTKIVALVALGQAKDVVAAYEKFEEDCETGRLTATREDRAIARFNYSSALSSLDRPADALSTYQSVVKEFGMTGKAMIQLVVAEALYNQGVILDTQGRSSDACSLYDAVLTRFGSSDISDIVEVVARSMVRKGGSLRDLRRFADARMIYVATVKRFEASESSEIVRLVAMAMLNGASMLDFLGRPVESQAAYDQVVRRFGAMDSPGIAGLVATALVNKGTSLLSSNRNKQAVAAYDEVLRRYSDSQSGFVEKMARQAVLGKSVAQQALGQGNAAIRTVDRSLSDIDTAPSEHHVTALLVRAEVYFESHDYQSVESELARMLHLLPRLSSLPELAVGGLMMFTVRLGAKRVLDLIHGSPARVLLEPLITALRQELGMHPKVPKEVQEVAKDIRIRLSQLKWNTQYAGL